MRKIRLVIIFFIFSIFIGCNNNSNENYENTEDLEKSDDYDDLENLCFLSESELNLYIQTNIQKLNFQNDPYGENLLYVELGDLLVTFDAYHSLIVKGNILIPYSYTFNEKFGSSYAIYKILDNKKGGVLLSFDDYYNPNWNNILQMFDKYEVKATFFCSGNPKTRSGFKEFNALAQVYEMEVGYHTLSHKVMTKMSKDDVFKEAIEPLNYFKDLGINISTISLPGGGIPENEDALELLLQNYKIVRASGLERINLYYTPEEISQGFIYGASFDQLFFENDESFRNMIKLRLVIAKLTGKIWPGFGHYFLAEDEVKDDTRYTVKVENLKYMLTLINTLKLESYLYRDFY